MKVAGYHELDLPEFADYMMNEAFKHSGSYTDKELYMLCSGIRCWKANVMKKRELINHLQEDWYQSIKHSKDPLSKYSTKALSAMYRLITSEFKKSMARDLIRGLILDQIDRFDIKEITEILSGDKISEIWDDEFYLVLAKQAKANKDILDERGYVNLFSALSKVNYRDEEWFNKVISHILEKPFQIFNQISILSSIARSGFSTDDMKKLAFRIAHEKDLNQCYLRDLTQFVLVFSFLFGDKHQDISHSLIRQIKDHHKIDDVDRSEIYQAMILTKFSSLKEAQDYLGEINDESKSTSFQKEIAAKIRNEIEQYGITLEEEVPIGNTHVDILVKGIKFKGKEIVIQVDGLCHATLHDKGKTMSTLVNTSILKEMGYFLIRIGPFKVEKKPKKLLSYFAKLQKFSPKVVTQNNYTFKERFFTAFFEVLIKFHYRR